MSQCSIPACRTLTFRPCTPASGDHESPVSFPSLLFAENVCLRRFFFFSSSSASPLRVPSTHILPGRSRSSLFSPSHLSHLSHASTACGAIFWRRFQRFCSVARCSSLCIALTCYSPRAPFFISSCSFFYSVLVVLFFFHDVAHPRRQPPTRIPLPAPIWRQPPQSFSPLDLRERFSERGATSKRSFSQRTLGSSFFSVCAPERPVTVSFFTTQFFLCVFFPRDVGLLLLSRRSHKNGPTSSNPILAQFQRSTLASQAMCVALQRALSIFVL